MGTTVLLGMRIGEGDGEGAACVIGTSVLVFGVLGVALIRRHGRRRRSRARAPAQA